MSTPAFTVSGMVPGTIEMAFGLVRDELFGSFLLIAFGGIWIEILKDSQLAMAPVDAEVARRRIAELRMFRVLGGVRGAPPCDQAALVDTYVKLGQLGNDLGSHIAEMDINPVLVSAEGVVAVDSLIIPAGASKGRSAHAV